MINSTTLSSMNSLTWNECGVILHIHGLDVADPRISITNRPSLGGRAVLSKALHLTTSSHETCWRGCYKPQWWCSFVPSTGCAAVIHCHGNIWKLLHRNSQQIFCGTSRHKENPHLLMIYYDLPCFFKSWYCHDVTMMFSHVRSDDFQFCRIQRVDSARPGLNAQLKRTAIRRHIRDIFFHRFVQ